MKNLGRHFLASAALLTATALSYGQAVEIKPQWITGKRYTQSVAMQQETTIEIAGQVMNQKVGTTTEIETTVKPHQDPKKKRLTQRYSRVTMDMDMAGQKMHFDSGDPAGANDPLGVSKALGAMAGKELQLILDENNKVIDIENLEQLTGPLSEGNPMAAQMIKGMLNKDAISQTMNQAALKALPGKPVKAGDTWPYNVSVTLPQLGAMTVAGKYTVKGMAPRGGSNCLELAETGELKMDLGQGGDASGASGGPADAIKQLGMKIDNGTISGTTWFDPALGTAREAQFKQKMTMKMKNPTDPTATLEVPMNQTITIKLTGVTDAK